MCKRWETFKKKYCVIKICSCYYRISACLFNKKEVSCKFKTLTKKYNLERQISLPFLRHWNLETFFWPGRQVSLLASSRLVTHMVPRCFLQPGADTSSAAAALQTAFGSGTSAFRKDSINYLALYLFFQNKYFVESKYFIVLLFNCKILLRKYTCFWSWTTYITIFYLTDVFKL